MCGTDSFANNWVWLNTSSHLNAKYHTYATEKTRGLLCSTVQLNLWSKVGSKSLKIFPAFCMKSERTHRCFCCLQVRSPSVDFVLDCPQPSQAKRKSRQSRKPSDPRVQTWQRSPSVPKDRNLTAFQTEIFAIHFCAFLSLQRADFYGYFIVMNSWLGTGGW